MTLNFVGLFPHPRVMYIADFSIFIDSTIAIFHFHYDNSGCSIFRASLRLSLFSGQHAIGLI